MAPAAFDVIDFAVAQGHGAKGLADMGLETLPKQYIHPPEEQIINNTIVSGESIKVIDLSDWTNPEVAKSICDAAENWGFFQIVNHGIPKQVLDDVKEATHRFFALPADVKNRYSKENSPTNNVRYGTSFLPHLEKPMEWKDSLSLFYVSDEETSAYWPPNCRKEIIKFKTESEFVVRKLLQALMKGLGIVEMDEAKEALVMGSRRVILNYYPKCPEPELTAGVVRHSDVSTLTMLLQDDVGGLYVKKSDKEEWIPVTPIDGAIVVNVGDALQILSNGKYKSIEHRVIANSDKDRISVPLFVNPRPSDVIGPLPEIVQNGEKAIYKDILYSDYVRHFYRKAHDGKDTLGLVQI